MKKARNLEKILEKPEVSDSNEVLCSREYKDLKTELIKTMNSLRYPFNLPRTTTSRKIRDVSVYLAVLGLNRVSRDCEHGAFLVIGPDKDSLSLIVNKDESENDKSDKDIEKDKFGKHIKTLFGAYNIFDGQGAKRQPINVYSPAFVKYFETIHAPPVDRKAKEYDGLVAINPQGVAYATNQIAARLHNTRLLTHYGLSEDDDITETFGFKVPAGTKSDVAARISGMFGCFTLTTHSIGVVRLFYKTQIVFSNVVGEGLVNDFLDRRYRYEPR